MINGDMATLRYFEWIHTYEQLPNDGERVLVRRPGYNWWEVAVWNGYYNVWDDGDGDDKMYDKDDVELWMRVRM